MKILVTGPDGLLGGHLVRGLLAEGHSLRCFVFKGSTSKTLDGLDIERFEGNILEAADVMAAMEGCDAVVHAAANTSVWPTRSAKIWQVNLDGTRNVVEAALQHNIKRLVHVGSANSFAHGTLADPGNETKPFMADIYGLDYIDSKYAAQVYVLKAVEERGLPAIIVNPTFMFGEYDTVPSSGKMLIAFYRQEIPGYTGGGRNFAYARDVAQAIINALTMGRIGECYIAGNANLYYKDLFAIFSRVTGQKPPRIKMPDFAILLYGQLGTFMGKITGKAPALNHAAAKVSCDVQFYSPAKAVRELQMPQTDIEEAIGLAFNWIKAYHQL